MDEDEVTFESNIRFSFLFQIRKMFDKADRDGDGKLTKEEWYKILNSSGCNTSMSVKSMIRNYPDQCFFQEGGV